MDRIDITLREGLHRHLAEHGFPQDGGDTERWVVLRVGPIPVCLPNLAVRRRAMLPHDLNHVVSGYDHDLVGELEIGAWEIGGGCSHYLAAWVLAWSGLVPGVVIAPKRVFAAFVRGRRTHNLFGTDTEAILDRPLAEVRASLGLNEQYRWNARDAVVFAGVVVLAPLVGTIPLLVSLVTSPLWLSQGAHRQRRETTQPNSL